jgi:hypothetical protein
MEWVKKFFFGSISRTLVTLLAMYLVWLNLNPLSVPQSVHSIWEPIVILIAMRIMVAWIWPLKKLKK